MRSMTFLVNDRSAGSGPTPAVAVTITENSDGSVSFSVNVIGGVTGDLRGFFFDVANESRIGTLSVTPTAPGFTEFRQGNDSVKDLGNGANMQGLLGSDGGYDAGVEIGTSGIKKDDYQSFSFTVKSSAGALTLDDFANVDIGVRLTSVGRDTWHGHDDRDGEAKLLEHTTGAIDAKDDAGSVTEDAPVYQVSGNVFSNDANLTAAHLITAVNGSAANIGDEIQGTYGTLRLNLDGSYTYTLDNSRAAVQALDAGQQVIETFTYAAANFDELTSVSSDSAAIRITIVGAADNVAPVITSAVATGSVTEAIDHTFDEGVKIHAASGSVDFRDVNLTDAHTVSVAAAASGYLGALNAAVTDPSTGDGAGQVAWNFQVSDAVIEHLGAGESLTQIYTLAIDDGHGGTASQQVTITINGANDAPFISTPSSAGAVAELADGAPGEGTALRSANGNLDFSDIDLTDTHSVSVEPASPGYLGTLSAAVTDPSTGDGEGQVGWTFQVSDAALERLGADDRVTQTYAVSVDDGHGAVATQFVDVTISGANDAPEIVGDASGSVFEDGSRRDSGQLIATDVDQGHVLTWSATGAGPMTPRADYRFLLDNLTVRNGTVTFFNDDFGAGGPPPSGPASPSTYFVGGTFIENNGRIIMDGSTGILGTVTPPGSNGTIVHAATLNTDTGADSSVGLKRGANFTVEARYDLTQPEATFQSYGLRLTDNADDVLEVAVRRLADGTVAVVLREADVPGTVPVTLQEILLTPAAGDNQIVLRLSHAANTDFVTGSFDLINGATVTQSHGFAPTPDIFTGEAWTRAQVTGFSPAELQNGVYGTLSVEADGQWHYSLNNGAANVQALAQGEHATDTFTVTVTDEHGASDTQTVTVDVAGSNDLPLISAASTTGGFVVEDSPFQAIATGQVIATDIDHGATLKWTVGPTTSAPVPGIPGATQFFGYRADYHFTLDQLTIARNGATVFDDQFNDGLAPPSAPAFGGQPSNYLAQNGQLYEQGGRLHLDGSLATAQRGIGNPDLTVGQLVVLATNNDPSDLTRGLKSDDDFTVEARYDLAIPDAGEVYGITLIDNTSNALPQDQLGDSSMSLLVRRDAGGNLIVQLNDFNVVTDVGATQQAIEFTPLAGENQIVLRLTHDRDQAGLVHAEFDLAGAGGVTRTLAFTQTAHIFGSATPDYAGDDESWTRVQLVAFGQDASDGTSLQGAYGTLSVQQNGQWTYAIDPFLSQSVAQGQFAQDVFSVRATDEHGLSSFRPVVVSVAGSNDSPFMSILSPLGEVQEDGAQVDTGIAVFSDADLIDTHTAFSFAHPGNTTALGTFTLSPVSESPATQDSSLTWTYTLNNGAAQVLAQGQTVIETYTISLTDNWGAAATTDVTVTITGANDAPDASDDFLGGTAGGSGALRVAVIGTSLASIFDAASQLNDSTTFDLAVDALPVLSHFTEAEWAAELANYDVVVIGGSGFSELSQYDSAHIFPALRGFVDSGGGIVSTGLFAFDVNGLYNQGWAAAGDADYISPVAYGFSTNSPGDATITISDPSHPIAGGIAGYFAGNSNQELTIAIDASATRLGQGPNIFVPGATTAIAYDEVGSGLTAYVGGAYLASNFAYNLSALRSGVLDQILEQTVAWAGGSGGNGGSGAFEDQVLTIGAAQLLANDTDIDNGDVVSIASVSSSSMLGASVSLDAEGNVVYDPTSALDYLVDGQSVTDTFTYTITDNHGATSNATVSVVVHGADEVGVNTPPIAVNDNNAGDPVIEQGVAGPTVVGDPQASGNVLANDIDPDPNPGLHVTEVNGTPVQFTTVVSGIYGMLLLGADGQWNYQLDNFDADTNALRQGEAAAEQFTYTVEDSAGAASSATLTVDITGSNDVPFIDPLVGTSGQVLEDGPTNVASGRLAGLDSDHGSTLHFELSGGTPVTPAYEFSIDQFTITRTTPNTPSTRILDDGFTDGMAPPISPPYSNGVAAGYATRGGFLEAGGHAVLDSDLAQRTFNFGPTPVAGNSALALTTNSGTNPDAGLRPTHTFDVMGRFDAILPQFVGQGYGISLSDQLPSLSDDHIQLLVQRGSDGLVHVVLREGDAVANATTLIDDVILGAVDADDQIVLHLAHNAADPGRVVGSFEVLDGGTVIQSHVFTSSGQIFGTETPGFAGDDDAFTRASFLSVSPVESFAVRGIYGTLVVETDGDWFYTLDNSDPDTQALGAGTSVVDSFLPLVIDELNVGSGGALNVTVFGANDAPVAGDDSVTGGVTEDAPVSIAVLANDHDVDTGAILHVSAVGTSARGAALSINADGTVQYDPTTSALLQALNQGESLADTFTYEIQDQYGATSSATVNVVVQGADDGPAAPADGEVFEDGSRSASGLVTPEGVDPFGGLSWAVDNPSVRATPDFRFLIDDLRIVRNGSLYFDDEFNAGGPPPQAPNLVGTATTVSYAMTGTFIESGNRAILDGSLSAPITSIGTSDPFHQSSALLLTDVSSDLSLGLKIDDSFAVEGRFDLVPPGALQAYGIRLIDQLGNDTIDVRVRGEADGSMSVVMRDVDVPGNVITILDSVPLELLPGENQIVLRLTHDATDPGAIHASFDLLGGTAPHSVGLGPVGRIFGTDTPGNPTDDEVFTRAQIVAVAPSDHQNGTYGSLHIDNHGAWTYALDNSSANVQSLAQGERTVDTFTVTVTDSHGARNSQAVSIDVVGSNDTPLVVGPAPTQFTGGYVVEDGAQQTATGVAFGSDADHGATLHWSVSRNPYSSSYLVQLDNLGITRNGAGFFSDDFNDGISPTAAGGAPAGFSYLPSGGFSESGGRAVLNGQLAASQRGVGIDDLIAGHLLTVGSNTDPNDLTRGLKSDDDFSVEARYDLTMPALAGQGYGVSLSDNTTGGLPPDQLGDDVITLDVVRDGDGSVKVRLLDRDVVADTTTVLESVALTPLAGEDQIVLRLSHQAADEGVVHASFDLLDDGLLSRHFELSEIAHIFGTGTPAYLGDDEDWTRVQLIAVGPDLGGSSVQGTFGTLSIDPNSGAWTYVLDNGSPAVQALGHGQVVTDALNVRVVDEHGMSSSRQLNIAVVGTGDPTPPIPLSALGSPAADTLVGTGFDDRFTGNGGNDLLIGLGGADTFDFNNLGDGTDTISDFTPGAGGDRLDLHDLLAALPGAVVFLAESNVPGFGPSTDVVVDPDGAGVGVATSMARLHGVTGLQLNDLLADGNLIL